MNSHRTAVLPLWTTKKGQLLPIKINPPTSHWTSPMRMTQHTKSPKNLMQDVYRMSVASCLWELFITLLPSNMRILRTESRFRKCGWGWWLVALGDVSFQPQHCAGYLLCLESYGRKSCFHSSFHIQGDFWSWVNDLKVAWTQTFFPLWILQICPVLLGTRVPPEWVLHFPFIDLWVLVKLIYSFQWRIKKKWKKTLWRQQLFQSKKGLIFSGFAYFALLRESLSGLP